MYMHQVGKYGLGCMCSTDNAIGVETRRVSKKKGGRAASLEIDKNKRIEDYVA